MSQPKKIIVWTDGCFDMMHYGHANALRQAKSLGDYLIVGVHSDKEILSHKGPPVMNEEERYEAVAACKWVDEVVKDAPYTTSLEVLLQHNVDFCVHGDDIVLNADGKDTYEEVKQAGKFRTVPRTQGVSTTDLVGRMLLLSKDHHSSYSNDREAIVAVPKEKVLHMSQGRTPKQSPYTVISQFLPSSKKLVQFSEGTREPKPDDKIVYIDGAFDLFHVGHVALLKEARKEGDYVIVGVHNDEIINKTKGAGWPVMNLFERVLSVLSCKFVDEVIIGAPFVITEEFLKAQRISVVIQGSAVDPAYLADRHQEEAYAAPKAIGMVKVIKSPNSITTSDIVQRIIANRQKYIERNMKKEEKEALSINNATKTT